MLNLQDRDETFQKNVSKPPRDRDARPRRSKNRIKTAVSQFKNTNWWSFSLNNVFLAGHICSAVQIPFGICFQSSSEMRLRTLSGSHWKHCFSDDISVLSALEVSTTMRYINRRLLTYIPVSENSWYSTFAMYKHCSKVQTYSTFAMYKHCSKVQTCTAVRT